MIDVPQYQLSLDISRNINCERNTAVKRGEPYDLSLVANASNACTPLTMRMQSMMLWEVCIAHEAITKPMHFFNLRIQYI
jgi:hypothetical protein